jgi:hypothetical protein
MNRFIKQLFLFISILTGIILLSFIILNYLNNKAFSEYKVKPNINILFIGDSHVRLAMNDRIIKNSINISQNAESFCFSYYKIKTLLDNNPSIRKIYLGLSYHCLSSYYDDLIYGKYSDEIASRYFFILPLREKINFIGYNLKSIHPFLKKSFNAGRYNITAVNNNYLFLGYYENPFNNYTADEKSMDRRLSEQFYTNGTLTPFSDFNISYLKRIVALCREKKVEVIALNTPLHPYYKSKIPEIYIKRYNEIVSDNQLKVEDFHNISLNDSCYTPDGDHVTTQGSLLISKQFKE